MVSEASLKVPETLDHFWVDIWLLNSGLIGLNEWFAFLLKKETLAAIGQIFVPIQLFFPTPIFFPNPNFFRPTIFPPNYFLSDQNFLHYNLNQTLHVLGFGIWDLGIGIEDLEFGSETVD